MSSPDDGYLEEGPINLYGTYLRKKYGTQVYRVSVDGGFSCPHRGEDREKEGCSYCDEYGAQAVYNRKRGYGELPDRFEENITAESAIRTPDMETQVKKAIDFLKKRYNARKFILYFQSFSSTYGDPVKLKKIYDEGLSCGKFEELAVSTRPDCIDQEIANLLAGYREKYGIWVELGLQSIHNRTLERINRGHTYEQFLESYRILKNLGIKISVHLIIGLPGESFSDMEESVREMTRLNADGLKFHNLHISFGTAMYDEYLEGELSVPGPEKYMDYLIRLLELVPRSTVIQRLTCDTPKIGRAAPRQFWKKTYFYDKIIEEMKSRNTLQGKRHKVIV